ncbi:MAG: DUF4198 domain-containing protein [Desulfovibrionales bacterium]|nr:MAG: DUF4198 domain-containing protein [Desulfovibrionales bacterium]
MFKKPLFFSTVLLTLVATLPVLCMAHYPWINMQSYQAREGRPANLTIGWGHVFPMDGFMSQDRIEELVILTPDGSKTEVEAKSDLEFASATSLAAGSHLVFGQPKSGYWTRTATGGRRQSKEDLDNVLGCSFSVNTMKAVLNVGDAVGAVDHAVGHPLEIIPMANPGTLRVGDYLPIRILLSGKPYSGFFHATHEGFSSQSDVFAYTARTDADGNGRLRLLNRGRWLVKVEHQEDYPDSNICDIRTYRGTLTFGVD